MLAPEEVGEDCTSPSPHVIVLNDTAGTKQLVALQTVDVSATLAFFDGGSSSGSVTAPFTVEGAPTLGTVKFVRSRQRSEIKLPNTGRLSSGWVSLNQCRVETRTLMLSMSNSLVVIGFPGTPLELLLTKLNIKKGCLLQSTKSKGFQTVIQLLQE